MASRTSYSTINKIYHLYTGGIAEKNIFITLVNIKLIKVIVEHREYNLESNHLMPFSNLLNFINW